MGLFKIGLLQKITSVDLLGGLRVITRMSQKGYQTAKTKTRDEVFQRDDIQFRQKPL